MNHKNLLLSDIFFDGMMMLILKTSAYFASNDFPQQTVLVLNIIDC